MNKLIDPGLVIFDCDGTLVDSEYLHNKVLADLLNECGLPQYDVAYTLENFAGWGLSGVIRLVEAEHAVKLPGDFTPRFVEGVIGNAGRWLKPVEGVRDVVAFCQRQGKICVASNGERPIVMSFLEGAGLRPFFPDTAIFTPEMVKKPKPAPDLFLRAASQHSASPERTLVIEDSITGVKAAKAAGMHVIGLTGTYHDKPGQKEALCAAGADIVIEQLMDIWHYIAAA